jgi:hypothetical protein
MSSKRRRWAGLVVLAVIIGLALSILIPRAWAGIGPNGFATYARQGIVNENTKVYGHGNSPWSVTCTDHPNYVKLTDTVTCQIREK